MKNHFPLEVDEDFLSSYLALSTVFGIIPTFSQMTFSNTSQSAWLNSCFHVGHAVSTGFENLFTATQQTQEESEGKPLSRGLWVPYFFCFEVCLPLRWQGFSTVALLMFKTRWLSFRWGWCCPMHSRMISSKPVLHPPDANTPNPHQLWQPKIPLGIARGPQTTNSTQTKNH